MEEKSRLLQCRRKWEILLWKVSFNALLLGIMGGKETFIIMYAHFVRKLETIHHFFQRLGVGEKDMEQGNRYSTGREEFNSLKTTAYGLDKLPIKD